MFASMLRPHLVDPPKGNHVYILLSLFPSCPVYHRKSRIFHGILRTFFTEDESTFRIKCMFIL